MKLKTVHLVDAVMSPWVGPHLNDEGDLIGDVGLCLAVVRRAVWDVMRPVGNFPKRRDDEDTSKYSKRKYDWREKKDAQTHALSFLQNEWDKDTKGSSFPRLEDWLCPANVDMEEFQERFKYYYERRHMVGTERQI